MTSITCAHASPFTVTTGPVGLPLASEVASRCTSITIWMEGYLARYPSIVVSMFQSRTHNCGELRLSNAGERVTLVGWLENTRVVGSNFAFVILRDFYGTTQLVVESEEMMNAFKAINKESTISITGAVRERASKNPKLPTGEIEVVPESVEVLGRCRYNELPFEINRSRDADETMRLKYRYLDLRNPAVKKNIILRCKVVAALRKAMAPPP